MKRSNNYYIEPVSDPDSLKQFEGWEIRKIHTGKRTGTILQNPDTGERRKLIISKACFSDNRLKVSRKVNL